MRGATGDELNEIFPVSRALAGPEAWDYLLGACAAAEGAEELPGLLSVHAARFGLPGFLPELARIEWAVHDVGQANDPAAAPGSRIAVNPALRLLRLEWKHLAQVLDRNAGCFAVPEEGEQLVLVWRNGLTGETIVRQASNDDLLALKMVVEQIEPEEAAALGGAPIYAVNAAIDRAVEEGLLIRPASRIRREPLCGAEDERSVAAPVFTLQWHITQACDLNCRHCYDRSDRQLLDRSKAMAVLDDFYHFCRERNVRGQISFSGGNPLLYPDFEGLYRAAAARGFGLAILGNPASRVTIERLAAIERPAFYQVSLEGLREINDRRRGPGHFDRTLAFFDVLRDLGVYSMVMLTLTKDNLRQVLPLAELLRERTDLFTFNRLSRVGAGANLELPSKEEYIAFLKAYTEAAAQNPVISLKDNLINIVLRQEGLALFDGCTGYGCGAAFNFLTLLPDGEVHACRKFPSLLGNINRNSLAEIYDCGKAGRYRAGSLACGECQIRPVCGGCLAIAHSAGLNPFEDRDPYCFIDDLPCAR